MRLGNDDMPYPVVGALSSPCAVDILNTGFQVLSDSDNDTPSFDPSTCAQSQDMYTLCMEPRDATYGKDTTNCARTCTGGRSVVERARVTGNGAGHSDAQPHDR